MEIRNYKKGDEIYILELFEKVFGRPMNPGNWKWRFEDNPSGKHMIKLMWIDGVLAGHYAVSPVMMRVDNKIIPTALSMTTMTNPNYTGRGVFGRLANALYESIHQESGIKVVWGFPNNNSHYGFISKLSWKNVGICHEIGVAFNPIQSFDFEKVEEVKEFTENHVNLFNTVNENFSVSVNKTVEYLTWRYVKHPSQKYRIFQISENGELIGLMVTKLYKSSKESWFINIIELATISDINVIGAILKKVVNTYQGPIKGITTWLNLFNNNYPLFEKLGFTPTGNMTYLGFRELNDGLEKFSELKNWSYSFGDSDVY